MEKKKLTLKEIGLPRLLILLGAGLLLLILSLPGNDGKDGESGGANGGSSTGDTSGVSNPGTAESARTGTTGTEEVARRLEERLETLLRKVKGIGEVEVMITLKSSAETVVLKDAPYMSGNTSESDAQGGQRTVTEQEQGEETVLTDDGVPYVIKQLEPKVEGVVILAQGASDAGMVSEIVEAVEVLFGVPAHKVKVMKMGN